MSNAIKFGILNSIIGLAVGIYITDFSIGDGYWIFIIGAPLSIFICGFFFWKLFFKKSAENKNGKLLLIGLLTGTVSHYMCWVFLSVGMNICHWITGNCTSSLGQPPAQIWQMLVFGVGMTAWSLFFFGWITILGSIGIGFMVDRIQKH